MFLLDTNVVSELRKSHTRIDANVARWAKSVDPELLYVSAITILELEIGILQIQRRDAAQAESLRLRQSSTPGDSRNARHEI